MTGCNVILVNSLEHNTLGISNIMWNVSPWHFTSDAATALKNFAIADFEPLPSASAFYMHLANEVSIMSIRLPAPVFVIYLVMYSITPALDVHAWQSILFCTRSINRGT